MIRPNSGIHVISMKPVFNKNSVLPIGELDVDHTSMLYADLILNHKVNLDKISNSASVIYYFHENDKNHLPEEMIKGNSTNILGNKENSYQNIKNIVDKYFVSANINLIVFANSIGYSSSELRKITDLLTIESDAVIIGKSINNGVSFIGFNYVNYDLFSDLHWDDMKFEDVLHKVNKYDNFVYVWESSLVVNSGKDFRLLYFKLSKKESLEYCDQQMHEKFTHIFIEYKELLK